MAGASDKWPHQRDSSSARMSIAVLIHSHGAGGASGRSGDGIVGGGSAGGGNGDTESGRCRRDVSGAGGDAGFLLITSPDR